MSKIIYATCNCNIISVFIFFLYMRYIHYWMTIDTKKSELALFDCNWNSKKALKFNVQSEVVKLTIRHALMFFFCVNRKKWHIHSAVLNYTCRKYYLNLFLSLELHNIVCLVKRNSPEIFIVYRTSSCHIDVYSALALCVCNFSR